jgi:hypothetical protein
MERQGGGPFDTPLNPEHPGRLDGQLGESAKTSFQETYDFVNAVNTSGLVLPRVLISHVPLYRPPNSPCDDPARSKVHGITREASKLLHQDTDRASTYQNMVGEEVTQWLLESLGPVAVFSGDDHDHCEYRHVRSNGRSRGLAAEGFGDGETPELTLKSVSMTEGVRRPGFARLSFYPAQTAAAAVTASFGYTPCPLPDQIAIWTHIYLPLLLATLLGLLLWPRIFLRSATAASRPHTGYLPLSNQRDDNHTASPPPSPTLANTPSSRPPPQPSRWLRDVVATAAVALPFWIVCQTHFAF